MWVRTSCASTCTTSRHTTTSTSTSCTRASVRSAASCPCIYERSLTKFAPPNRGPACEGPLYALVVAHPHHTAGPAPSRQMRVRVLKMCIG